MDKIVNLFKKLNFEIISINRKLSNNFNYKNYLFLFFYFFKFYFKLYLYLILFVVLIFICIVLFKKINIFLFINISKLVAIFSSFNLKNSRNKGLRGLKRWEDDFSDKSNFGHNGDNDNPFYVSEEKKRKNTYQETLKNDNTDFFPKYREVIYNPAGYELTGGEKNVSDKELIKRNRYSKKHQHLKRHKTIERMVSSFITTNITDTIINNKTPSFKKIAVNLTKTSANVFLMNKCDTPEIRNFFKETIKYDPFKTRTEEKAKLFNSEKIYIPQIKKSKTQNHDIGENK